MQRSGRSGRHIDRAHVRVINVEKPVETHVNAKWHIDEVFVLLLQAVVDGCQAVDDVGDGQQLTVVGELVLLERVLSHAEVQQVHCRGRMEGKGRKGERRRKVHKKIKRNGENNRVRTHSVVFVGFLRPTVDGCRVAYSQTPNMQKGISKQTKIGTEGENMPASSK